MTAAHRRPQHWIHPAGQGDRLPRRGLCANFRQNDALIIRRFPQGPRRLRRAVRAKGNWDSRRGLRFDRQSCNSVAAHPPARDASYFSSPPRPGAEQVLTAPRLWHQCDWNSRRGTIRSTGFCSEIAGKYGLGFVNVNLRPITPRERKHGLEIVEATPAGARRVIPCPMASDRFSRRSRSRTRRRSRSASSDGSRSPFMARRRPDAAPISQAFKAGTDLIRPVPKRRPSRSRSPIATPADGLLCGECDALQGGSANASDEEIIEGIRLLGPRRKAFFAERPAASPWPCREESSSPAQDSRRNDGGALHSRPRSQDRGSRRRRISRAAPDQPQPA